ncbi:hypothetical protein [Streptomyces sp. NPDC006610]|jgi:hypothetical protein
MTPFLIPPLAAALIVAITTAVLVRRDRRLMGSTADSGSEMTDPGPVR